MRKSVYALVGFFVLVVFFLYLMVSLFGWAMSGMPVYSMQPNFSYCDYNISCGFDSWQEDKTYCLNESQYPNSSCFDINSDGVVLDMQGFSINGSYPPSSTRPDYCVNVSSFNVSVRGGWIQGCDLGINSSGDMTTLENLIFIDVDRGVYFSRSSDSIFRNSTLSKISLWFGIFSDSENLSIANVSIFSDSSYGFFFENVTNSSVSSVNAYDGFVDIVSNKHFFSFFYLQEVNNTVFRDIVISNFTYGAYLDSSFDNSFSNISINLSEKAFYIKSGQGNQLNSSDFSGNNLSLVDESCSSFVEDVNGTDDLPIVYLNETVNVGGWENNFSQLILCGADNSFVSNVSASSQGVFIMNSDNVTVENLSSLGSYLSLYAWQSDSLNVNGVYSDGSLAYSLYCESCNNSYLDNVTSINSEGIGIPIVNSENLSLVNSYVNNSLGPGVYLDSSRDIEILDSVFFYNQYGIYALSLEESLFRNLTLYNSSHAGVFISLGFSNDIVNVTSRESAGYGLYLHGSDNNSVNDSFFENNSDGVYLLNSEDNSFYFVNSSYSEHSGFYLEASSYNSFLDCKSYRNLDGFWSYSSFFGSSYFNTIRDSSFYNNSGDGLRLTEYNSGFFSNISVFNNSGDGVSLYDSNSSVFYDLYSYNNSLSGVKADRSYSSNFYNLRLSNNGNLSNFTGLSTSGFVYNVSSDNLVSWSFTGSHDFGSGFDLSKHISFDSDSVDVDSSQIPAQFNSSARIRLDLSGVDITYPKVLVDTYVCSMDDCPVDSFDDDVIVFDVPHFSEYSVIESSCGDDYCSITEDCNFCSEDCGECSSDDGSTSGGATVTSSSSSTNLSFGSGENDSSVEDESESGSDSDSDSQSVSDEEDGGLENMKEFDVESIPWVMISVGGFFLIVFLVVLMTIFIFLRKNLGSGEEILSVRPKPIRRPGVVPSRPSKKKSPEFSSKKVVSKGPKNPSKKLGDEVGPKKSKGSASSAALKNPSIKARNEAGSKKSKDGVSSTGSNYASYTSSAAYSNSPRSQSQSGSQGVGQGDVGIFSIKDYVTSKYPDCRERIQAYLKIGENFLKNRDVLSADKIYSFVYEDYSRLRKHDEGLYRQIVSFHSRISSSKG